MRNRPNLAVAFTEKNAYPDFFNKVRERNKAIDDCDLEIDLKIDLNEDTIIKIKQALKDKLASEKNVYDKNFEINKYLGEQKEIIKKKVKEGREATEEWVNGNNKISNNLKDKGFVDALTNSTVQAMFSNVGF
ncbi:MAG: hypothetical protein LBC61_06935 [Candidatus Peribacteria bacterium]|jgi:hypothetical protein|nr:hypothetical protein [Candidatus Peribacteria bacterium]